MKLTKPKALGGAIALTCVIGGGVAGASLAAGPSVTDNIAVLSSQPSATLNPAAQRLAAGGSFADYQPRLASAKSMGATGGGGWAIVPATDGACLVGPDGGLTCVPTAAVASGRLMAIRAPQALPDQLSPVQMAAAAAGKPVPPSGGSLAGASIVGVAPDGTSRVELRDASGAVVASSPVSSNGYAMNDVPLDRAVALVVIGADGTARSSKLK